MNAWKFCLAAMLFSGIQTVSVAATDSGEKNAPAKPSLVTPEMMAKYAITKQTLDKNRTVTMLQFHFYRRFVSGRS